MFRRVMWLMLIGVGAPLTLSLFLSITSSREALVQQSKQLQAGTAQYVGGIVRAHVRSTTGELAALESGLRDASGRLDVAAALRGKARSAFLSFIKSGGNAIHLELLNLRGKGTRVGVGISDPPVLNRMDQVYAAVCASDRPVLGRPVFSTRLNQLLFVVGRPLFNRGTRAGALLSVASLEPLLKSIREENLSGLQVVIVDQDGKLIADLDRNRTIDNTDYSANEIVRSLRSVQGLGTITRPFVDQRAGTSVTMIGTGAPIPETGWSVIAQTPQSQAYAGANSVMWTVAILTAGALLLALALSAVFWHRMVQPLRRLAESARRVADGNYNTDISIDDTSEIGAVASAFREMARQVQENLAKLKSAVEDSKQLFTGTVRALANAIDGKDPYTRGHSERVTRFSVEIARMLELPEDEVEKIKLGALIHDVGKIAIDDRILKKPGILTDEEYQVMKTHTTRGYDMMKHISQLEDIIPGMHCHHEQLDGKGYPRGLKGDEIPMIARVITVADCFDAMTTQRPYQDPAPIDHVLGILRSEAGTKYDEKVVEALIRGVKTGRIIPHTAA